MGSHLWGRAESDMTEATQQQQLMLVQRIRKQKKECLCKLNFYVDGQGEVQGKHGDSHLGYLPVKL